jgi:hypothetical protein
MYQARKTREDPAELAYARRESSKPPRGATACGNAASRSSPGVQEGAWQTRKAWRQPQPGHCVAYVLVRGSNSCEAGPYACPCPCPYTNPGNSPWPIAGHELDHECLDVALVPRHRGLDGLIAQGFGFVVPARMRRNTLRISSVRAGATEPKNKLATHQVLCVEVLEVRRLRGVMLAPIARLLGNRRPRGTAT